MARPITWQNVNSPQGAVSIEAMLRSGRAVTEGIDQIANVFKTARDEMKAAATGAAVAQIANAEDPMAVVAAAPKTWQFDPMAIATAANARDTQLFDRKVSESNLRENELQMTNLQSEMADRESKRHIATLIAPYEALARAGKDFDVDEASDPMWKTPAGFEAKKYLEELKNTAFNQSQERARTAAANTQARLAQLQLEEAMARKKADDMWAEYKLTPQGMLNDPIIDAREAKNIGIASGAGPAYGLTLAPKNADIKTGATEGEKNRNSAAGPTYAALLGGIDSRLAREEEAGAVTDTLTQIQAEAALADKENNYKEKTPEALVQSILKNNPEVKDGVLGLGWEQNDVMKLYNYQGKLAKEEVERVAKKYDIPLPPNFMAGQDSILTPQQQASLAAMAIHDASVFDDEEDNAAAKSMREKYIVLNLTGGRAGYETRVANEKASRDKTKAELQRIRRLTEISAAQGLAAPQEAITLWNETPAGQARAETMRKLQGLGK